MNTYLHVRMSVRRENRDAFIAEAKNFLQEHFLEGLGWEFLQGFEVIEAELIDDLTRARQLLPPQLVHFVNVWRIPPDTDISAIMLELSELASYVKLDNLVVTEQQEIVLRVSDPLTSDSVFAAALVAGATFAIVRHYLFRDALAQFVFNSGALAASLGEKSGYSYAGCYQNITGLLNEFWEIWQLDTAASKLPSTQAPLLEQTRAKLAEAIRSLNGIEIDEYKAAIYFDKSSLPSDTEGNPGPDGTDDGLIIVKKAPYWSAT